MPRAVPPFTSTRHGRITLRTVDALAPKEQLWDSDLKGFVVRCQARAKVYGVKVRVAGRQRWVTIGEHGVFTPEMARREAQRIKGSIAAGDDPASDRDRTKALPSLADFADTFLADHVSKLKKTTQAEYTRLIETHIKRVIGMVRIDALADVDVSRLHQSLKASTYEANRAVAVLSSLLTFAERRKVRPKNSNACQGFERFNESKRERFLTTGEFATLADTMNAVEAEGKVSPYAIEALRMLIFTGARRNEVLRLRWEHVDFERKMLFLPDSKTGKKTIHLSPPALAILARLPRLAGNLYCFAGGRSDHTNKGSGEGEPIKDLMGPWSHIRQRAGLDGVRVHDLRHSFASVAAARGGSLLLIGKLVGHRNAATTARYAHLAADPAQQLNDQTGAAIAAAMGIAIKLPSSDVVALPTAKRGRK